MKVQQDMKTSIIGYPRIGSLRELKFASEKYFRSEIPSEELLETAKEIRLNNWDIQKANGIELIPSNDFSLYFLPTVKYYIRISLATHFYVVFKRYLCVIYFLSNYRLPLVPFGVFNICCPKGFMSCMLSKKVSRACSPAERFCLSTRSIGILS